MQAYLAKPPKNKGITMYKLTFSLIILALTSCTVSNTANSNNAHSVPHKIKPSIEIISPEARLILDNDAAIKTLSSDFTWTEGPIWLAKEGYLIFSDIPNNKIMKYHPAQGVSVYLENSGATGLHQGDYVQGSNGLLLDQQGNLILLQQGDRRVAVMNTPTSSPSNNFKTLAGYFNGKRLNSPNDAVLHSDGSLFFTDPPYGLKNKMDDKRKELTFQGIYRLAPDGNLQLLDDKISLPNGIAISVDEKTLYVAVSDESFPHWLAYDLSSDGKVSNKRVWVDASEFIGVAGEQGMPDGMAVHSSGLIFATGPGGVWLITPKGKILAKIKTGKLTANCTLSTDEKTLYLTAHNTLMSVDLK